MPIDYTNQRGLVVGGVYRLDPFTPGHGPSGPAFNPNVTVLKISEDIQTHMGKSFVWVTVKGYDNRDPRKKIMVSSRQLN